MMILTNKILSYIFESGKYKNDKPIYLFFRLQDQTIEYVKHDNKQVKTGYKYAGYSISNIITPYCLLDFDRIIFNAIYTIIELNGINKTFTISDIYRVITGRDKGKIFVSKQMKEKIFNSIGKLQQVTFDVDKLFQKRVNNTFENKIKDYQPSVSLIDLDLIENSGDNGKSKTPLIKLNKKGFIYKLSKKRNEVRGVASEILLTADYKIHFSENKLLIQWHLIRLISFLKHKYAKTNKRIIKVNTLCERYNISLYHKKYVIDFVLKCLEKWKSMKYIKDFTYKKDYNEFIISVFNNNEGYCYE